MRSTLPQLFIRSKKIIFFFKEQTEVSTQNNLQSEYTNVKESTQSEDIGTQTDNYNLLDSSTSSSTDKYVTEQIDTTDNTDVSSHSAQERKYTPCLNNLKL